MKWILFFAIIILFSCDNSSKDINGTYISERPSKIERIGYFINHNAKKSIKGQKLELRKDSSYIYYTCGHIFAGSWSVSNNRLVFNEISKQWKNDSLNKINYPFGKPAENFFNFSIKNDKLVSFFKGSLSDIKMINQLIKVK